jgi:hypothetical protein
MEPESVIFFRVDSPAVLLRNSTLFIFVDSSGLVRFCSILLKFLEKTLLSSVAA